MTPWTLTRKTIFTLVVQSDFRGPKDGRFTFAIPPPSVLSICSQEHQSHNPTYLRSSPSKRSQTLASLSRSSPAGTIHNAGWTEGKLPFGVTFLKGSGYDERVLDIAAVFEEAVGAASKI